LPTIAVFQKPFFVEIEFLSRLCSEFRIRPFDDRTDRPRLLAESAIDAFHHVDVVARCATRAVVTSRPGFNGDGLGRTNRLAELAGDTALLAVRIAPQRMLAAVARRLRIFLMRII